MRKIWNFAMAAIVIVASAGLLAACDKDDVGTDNPWSNGEYEFAETDLTVMEVLSSISSTEVWMPSVICYYTEPDMQGEMCEVGMNNMLSGERPSYYTFSRDMVTRYVGTLIPYPCYYIQNAFTKVDDNTYTFGNDGEYYWKIISYDETKLLIEGNTHSAFLGGIYYGYSTIVLKRGTPSNPDWKDSYLTYEEFLELMENRN
ncbi:MAG: hypothetical protein J6C60_03405 [Alistipes sp.]|nr:hypothetical protein [Alistipes sp.]MBO5399714.1 hypothetical protein [Alistipes sp.]MBP3474532.1 hypothetical protein [Alistipes sp.]